MFEKQTVTETVAHVDRETEATERLKAAKLRLDAAQSAMGAFNADRYAGRVFLLTEILDRQSVLELELTDAGKSFQRTLQDWARIKTGR